MSSRLPESPQADPIEASPNAIPRGWALRARHFVAANAGFRMPNSAARQILGRQVDPLAVSTSYVILRNGIGVLGFALPIVMIVGGGLDHVQGSLSAYYHFSSERPAEYGAGTMRDLFVGLLCAIGAFLFFYRGHSIQEDMALNIAGIAAVLVALFPMDWPIEAEAVMSTTSRIHSAAATIFFVMIAYVCVVRARDTLCIVDDGRRRRTFERVYLIFGLLMLATPATVALLNATSAIPYSGFKTLIVEAAGVFVFAAFWLVKSFEIRSSLRTKSLAAPHIEPS